MSGINNHLIDYKNIQKDKFFEEELLNEFVKLYFDYDVNVERLYGGFRNSTALITKGTNKFVLKVYSAEEINPNHTYEGISAEWDFIKYLGRHGIPTTEIILNIENKTITKHANRYAVLMSYIEGSDGRYNLNDQKFRNIGVLMGKMHKLAMKYNPPNERPSPAKNPFENLKSKFEKDGNKNQAFESLYAQYSKLLPKMNKLHKYYIHGDLIFSNLVFKEDDISGVLDFDDMNKDLLLKEVTVFIISAYDHHDLYKMNKSYITSFLSEYTKIRPLNITEKEIILLYLEMSQVGIRKLINKYRPNLEQKFMNETDEVISYIKANYC